MKSARKTTSAIPEHKGNDDCKGTRKRPSAPKILRKADPYTRRKINFPTTKVTETDENTAQTLKAVKEEVRSEEVDYSEVESLGMRKAEEVNSTVISISSANTTSDSMDDFSGGDSCEEI